jgi:hypothetical protein
MSIPQEAKPAKLVIGLIVKQRHLLQRLSGELSSLFGAIDLISAWMPFDYTSYYENEMGTPLYRRMLAFDNLIQQNDLVTIKLATNQIEQIFSKNNKRRVNIDPGYLLLERFVLASGKNFSHRIYLGDGIYADLTLLYSKGGFRKLPWTYPDYADVPMLKILERVRAKYILDIGARSKSEPMPSTPKPRGNK